MGIQISEDSWKKLVICWYGCSCHTQSQRIQYKLLHRSYWTPSKLFRLNLVDKDTCWKCQKEAGTLVHMLYACEKNVHMCDGIINLLKGPFQFDLSKSPALCVLSLLPDSMNLSGRQKLWVRLATITRCRIIMGHWTSSNSCCFKEWTEKNGYI